MDVWSKLKHFSKSENWGDPDRMDEQFLIDLDDFREVIGKSCELTSAAFAKDGHLSDSFHYKGLAVDCRFWDPDKKEPLSLKEHVLIALRAPFYGVGIYSWHPNGPFLHLDGRQKTYDRKIWVCEKEGEYKNLSIEFLEKVFGGNS